MALLMNIVSSTIRFRNRIVNPYKLIKGKKFSQDRRRLRLPNASCSSSRRRWSTESKSKFLFSSNLVGLKKLAKRV